MICVLVKNLTIGKCYWCGAEISDQKYNEIKSIILSKPTAPDGHGYRLTAGLTWELYVLPEEADPDLTAEEALDIIFGGGANA